jgi:hypothetical protein
LDLLSLTPTLGTAVGPNVECGRPWRIGELSCFSSS